MFSFFKAVLAVLSLQCVVLLSLATLSFAQGRGGDLKGAIPFPFVVENQRLPAGNYTITPLGETAFRIRGEGNIAVLVQTHRAEQREPAAATKMIFQRRQNNYVLSEFWTTGNRIGRQLFLSGNEKETRVRGADEVAVVLSVN